MKKKLNEKIAEENHWLIHSLKVLFRVILAKTKN